MLLEVRQDGTSTIIELFTDDDCPWPTIGSQIYAVATDTAPWSTPGGIARLVPVSPVSQSSFDNIKSWLDVCIKEHSWCNLSSSALTGKVSSEVLCPKRLLFLGDRDEDVRLCQLNEPYRMFGMRF